MTITGFVTFAVTLILVVVREPAAPPRPDYEVLESLLLGMYEQLHPRPPGALEDPQVRKYDADALWFRSHVLEFVRARTK